MKLHLEGADPPTQRVVLPLFVPGEDAPWPPIEHHVVGVFADVRSRGAMDPPRAEIAIPFWQTPWPSARVTISTLGDALAVRRSVEAIV